MSIDLASATNRPVEVPDWPDLDAVMLDVTASWEAITRRHADPETADRLIDNEYFRAVADRFPAAQAYAAGEQIAEFADSGVWSTIVVDTPPASGGLDFFAAPRRMSDLVGGRVLRLITGSRIPGRKLLYKTAGRPMLRLADNLLGSDLLEDIADFLLDLRSLYDGLSSRAAAIDRMLIQSRVFVVTTDSPGPVREAARFFAELPEIDVKPEALLFNRALPDEWTTARGPNGSAPQDQELRENMQRWGSEARRNRDARSAVAARLAVPMRAVPWVRDAPTTVAELAELVSATPGLESLLAESLTPGFSTATTSRPILR